MLATWLAKQWIGGYAAISEGTELCLQEDLASFIADKVIKRMTNDEFTRLGQLAKVSFFVKNCNIPTDKISRSTYLKVYFYRVRL